MKHKHILFGLLALMVASCTNDEMNEVAEMKQNGIQVTADFGADTRIDFSEEANVTHVFWNEGDQITIYDEAQGGLDYQVASVSNGGATANFSAINVSLQETAEGATVNAIYPALPVEDGIVKLPNTNVWNEDRLIPYATAYGTISDSKLNLKFGLYFAYLKLTLNAETVANSNAQTIHAVYLQTTQDLNPLAFVNGIYNTAKNNIVHDGEGANSIHFSLNEPFTATGNAEKVIYIPILPQSAGETLTLSILHHDDYGVCDTLLTVSKQVPESGFTYGNVYTYTPKQSFTRDENNTITVFEPGVLSQAISEEEKYAIKELKIIGPLNGDDIRLIREMAGIDIDDHATEGVLTYLDISEATIVEGGGPYFNHGIDDFTSNNDIGMNMFSGTKLQNIILPNSVTSIGNNAFRACSSLTSTNIPDGVTSIGDHAFNGCSLLEKVTISSQSALTSIGDLAFWGCSSLTSINIPDGVTSIGRSAFYECSLLESVTISLQSALTSIDNSTFQECSSLTSIIIPDGVVSIGGQAFLGCSLLANVTISSQSALTSVGDLAFFDCPSLAAVYISDLSTWCEIDFEGDSSNPLFNRGKLYLNDVEVTELLIPNDITEIKKYAFKNYSFLTSLVIPVGVTSIGEYAFFGCSSLSEVTCKATTPPALGSSVFSSIAESAILYVPTGTCDAYMASDWAQYFTTIDDGEEHGGSYENGVATVVTAGTLSSLIPEDEKYTITTLKVVGPLNGDDIYLLRRMIAGGEYGGVDVGKLTTLDLSEASIVEGGGVYYYASNGVDYYTLDNVIGDHMFRTSAIESIILPINVTSIGESAFEYSTSLKSITIPDNVTSIGESAFKDCSSLASVIIGNGVNTMGNMAFQSCSSLTSVTINNGATLIGDYAFCWCPSLATINIGSGVTTIGVWAFVGCSSLESIVIPNGVTSIGEQAFYGCSSMTSITIGSSVTSIGEFAFQECQLLSDVTCLATTPPTLDSYVFSDIASPSTLIVPIGCTTIYSESDWVNYFTAIYEK